jgi:glutamate 5-kinase
MNFDFDLVGKIGSIALIQEVEHDIDYVVFSRIGSDLHQGMIWVGSRAVEFGGIGFVL